MLQPGKKGENVIGSAVPVRVFIQTREDAQGPSILSLRVPTRGQC